MAGFRELMMVEWDDHAVECFRRNFVDGPIGGDHKPHVHHGDITKIDAQTILETCNLEVGELDVFDGSPPCQGFSTSGNRVVEDERNQLFMHFARLVEGIGPKVFVMENVVGMTQGAMVPTFAMATKILREKGYNVAVRILDGSWLGLPQARNRTIFVGTRIDLSIDPRRLFPNPWPFQTHLRGAIADLQGGPEQWGPSCAITGKIETLALHMRPGRKGTDQLGPRGGFDLKRERWDRPTRTVLKTHSPHMYSGILHPVTNRYLGINELKRVGGFPDGYDFATEHPDWWTGEPVGKGPEEKQIIKTWNRIGNSVPPLIMFELASAIRKEARL